MGDDTYIFHQTYVPEQLHQSKLSIWNAAALSMIPLRLPHSYE